MSTRHRKKTAPSHRVIKGLQSIIKEKKMSNEPERKYTVYSENKSKNYVRFLIKNDGSEDSEAIFLKD